MKYFCFVITFVLFISVELKTTHKTPDDREKYLRELPDKIIKNLHDQMKNVMEKRAYRYPEAKNVKHVNLDRTLAAQPSHVSFGFKWHKNKFMRSYDKKDWIFEHKLQNSNTMTKKNSKKPITLSLHNRWAKRKENKKQMQCMLYGKVYAIEKILQISVMLVKVKFRSPCMETSITKVFVVDNQSHLPVVFKLNIGPELFIFEFNNSLSKSGYGLNKKEVYKTYRLINFYYAATNPIFKNAKKQSDAEIIANQTRNLKNKEATTKDLKTTVEKVKFNRKLYKQSKDNHIPFKHSGNDYIVLGGKDNLKPYFTFEDIKNLWGGGNTVFCSPFSAGSSTNRIRRSWNYYEYNQYSRSYVYKTYVYYIEFTNESKGMQCRA